MPIQISWQGATLGANTFTGAQAAPSLALGGATILGYALAVTGTADISGNLTVGGTLAGSGALRAGSTSGIYWQNRTNLFSTADRKLSILDNGTNALGGLIDVTTNGTFKFFAPDGTTPAPIQIGNVVNSVSPTSPNRTVTMVIGGTTYYLAAKTTND